jgi:hypothetical protein
MVEGGMRKGDEGEEAMRKTPRTMTALVSLLASERRLQDDRYAGGLRQMIVCLVVQLQQVLGDQVQPQWKGCVARGILWRLILL